MQFDTSWMRVRRQVRAVTLYLAYQGQQNPTTKRTVNMTVFAVDSEILAARWYNVTWDPNGDVPIPGFDWAGAGIEPRMQRVGSVQAVLNQQKGMWTRSQYVPVRLDANWFNRFLSTQVCSLVFVGHVLSFFSVSPHVVQFGICINHHQSAFYVVVHSVAPTHWCCDRQRTRKP